PVSKTWGRAQRGSKGERNMKRMIAGVLLLIGMGAGTMFAEDGYWRDRRDIRHDEARIARERRERRRDLDYGNYAAARHKPGPPRLVLGPAIRSVSDFKTSAARQQLGDVSNFPGRCGPGSIHCGDLTRRDDCANRNPAGGTGDGGDLAMLAGIQPDTDVASGAGSVRRGQPSAAGAGVDSAAVG